MLQQDSIENTGLRPLSGTNFDSVDNQLPVDLSGVAGSAFSVDSVGPDSGVLEVPKTQQAVRSVFHSHTLERQGKEPLEHHYVNIDWISVHFILLLGLLAWTRINYRVRLYQIVKSFVASRYLYQMMREGSVFRERVAIPLFVVYLVSFSMLVYLLLTNFSDFYLEGYTGFKLFAIILLIVLILWFVKNITVHFIGVTFKNELILQDFMLTNFVFNLVSGLLLFPVIAVSVYVSSKDMLLAALVFWLLIFVFKIARELFTGLSYTKF
ncbi:MAG: DUF4271 domain-containing protein, partial [Chlorobi bacterium]|nr:DUF4271 domain-containing protein [Chlorobiota bacterium]